MPETPEAPSAPAIPETPLKPEIPLTPEAPSIAGPEKYELPPAIQEAKALAEIDDKQASAQQKRSQAFKTGVDAMLAPQQADHQAAMDAANFEQGIRDRAEDRTVAARQTQS